MLGQEQLGGEPGRGDDRVGVGTGDPGPAAVGGRAGGVLDAGGTRGPHAPGVDGQRVHAGPAAYDVRGAVGARVQHDRDLDLQAPSPAYDVGGGEHGLQGRSEVLLLVTGGHDDVHPVEAGPHREWSVAGSSHAGSAHSTWISTSRSR